MQLVVDSHHLGTPESSWLSFAPLVTAPWLEWPAPGRVVVVAPHPDDEVLAVGGTMRALADLGHEVEIVAVTDGEASHPRSRVITPAELAARRADERAAALACLGVPGAVRSFHCPDGGVAHTAQLAERIAERLVGATCCIAPWDRDGHPDHDAVGSAALRASARTGVTLWQYPVWAWHLGLHCGLPWSRARRVLMTSEVQRSKNLAIEAYRSQIEWLGDEEPILPPSVLARFRRPFETLFV